MAAEDWALFFHVLGALLLVAGVAVAGLCFEAARRRTEPREIALLLGVGRLGLVLVGPGSLLVLGFGLWLVRLGHWGYGAGWVDAALALFAAMAVLGAIGGQRPKRARLLAERLAREGAGESAGESAELRALLDDRVARALNDLSALLLVAIVVLMVFKPGAH
jgi:uncharacterized membrane protein